MIRSVIRAWATRTNYHHTQFLAPKGLRYLSTDASSGQNQHDFKKIRNIGIIAHIDAGKTTTTERMLYYSGFTRRIGVPYVPLRVASFNLDVDEGSTVTDFLPAERARGITIQSAAITFHWPPLASGSALQSPQANAPQFRSSVSHTINLIDTPGHADFTFEVLRSLRVLDGAICILDGVAGVEAQTEQVWRQASLYKIPRIIYVNKLDRDGAAFSKTVKQIGTRLFEWPAVCQIPWWEGTSGRFLGIGDVVRLRGLKWQGSLDGTAITAFTLNELENEDSTLASELKRARIALVELLSEHDDAMVEKFLEHDEDHLAIPAADVSNSLRKCLLLAPGQVVPVFAGASFRNMGVQPLLDAVVDLLPDPAERPDPEVTLGAEARSRLSKRSAEPAAAASHNITRRLASLSLGPVNTGAAGQSPTRIEGCALAFKVVHDARRGVLIYVRVYAGTISKSALLFNTNVRVSERGNRLFRMLAADAAEIQELHAGEIGVIVGLNHARTGDTLVAFAGGNPKRGPPAPWDDVHLQAIDVPPPVFFASVVPRSLSDERQLHEALALLLREDPSLTLSVDDESGQMLLGGMGQLHLEIARDRLAKDFRARADMGSIEIAFRECVLGASAPTPYIVDSEIAGKRAKAGCEAQVQPLLHSAPAASSSSAADRLADQGEATGAATHVVERDGNLIEVRVQGADGSGGRKSDATNAALLPASLSLPAVFSSLANGALGALVRSPAHGYPMHGTHVVVTLAPPRDLFGNDSTPGALVAAARHATRAALGEAVRRAGTSLMEPVMRVTISLDEGSLGAVVHDISSARGGHVLSLDAAAPDSHLDTPPAAATTTTATADSSHNSHYGEADDAEAAPVIDVSRIYAPPDPFGDGGSSSSGSSVATRASRPRTIQARVPLQEMVGYLKHLRSLTAGRGTFVMSVDRFERMSSHREKKLLASLLTAS